MLYRELGPELTYHTRSGFSVCDRIIGGDQVMSVCTALAILITFRHVLLPMRTKEAILNFLFNVWHCTPSGHARLA